MPDKTKFLNFKFNIGAQLLRDDIFEVIQNCFILIFYGIILPELIEGLTKTK
jgi:hypothetical protein